MLQPDMRMGQDQLSQQPRQQRFRPAPDSWPSGSQPTSAVSGHKRGHGMIEEDGSADRKPAMMVDSKGFAMPAASSGMQHSNGSGHDAADPAVKEDPVESERKRQAHEDLLGKVGVLLCNCFAINRSILDFCATLRLFLGDTERRKTNTAVLDCFGTVFDLVRTVSDATSLLHGFPAKIRPINLVKFWEILENGKIENKRKSALVCFLFPKDYLCSG